MKVAASLLSADFSKLGEEIARVETAGIDLIHIDVMDGHFVPNITIGPAVISRLRSLTKMFFDVHLMISDPDRYIDSFVEAGADLITVHVETCRHLHRTIQKIKSRGIKVGVALNPATSLSAVEWVLGDLDLVLLMTVNPGFGGQKMIDAVLPKIEELQGIRQAKNMSFEIQVDGGIDVSSITKVAKAGASIAVSGSALFKASDMGEFVRILRQNAEGR